MKKTIIPNSHEEWLNIRTKGIGSSEVGVLLGVNPYETKYQLWRRKMGIDPQKEETFAMKAGHYLEDGVAQMFQDETGYFILEESKADFIIVDESADHRRVSPDRIYLINPNGGDSIENKGILECKTTQMNVDEDDVPPYWYAQLQYQLGVSGIKRGAIAWLCSGRSFGYKEYDFDPAFWEQIISAVDEFWMINILQGVEPEQTTAFDIILKWDKSTDGKTIEATEDVSKDLKNLKECKSLMKDLEEQISELEVKIKAFMMDSEAITINGKTVASYKNTKPSSSFDKILFKKEHGDLYKSYCKDGKRYRRFLIK